MNKEINLAPHKRKEVLEKQKYLQKFRIISVSFFGISMFLTFAVVLLNFFSPVIELKREKETLLSQLSAYNSQLGKYSFITSRIRDISDIVAKRSSYHEIMQDLISNLPENITIESFRIGEKKVNIIISSSSLVAINSFFESLTALTLSSSVFERATIDTLNSDSGKGEYNATITLDTT